MWYLELLIYITTVLAISSSILPWSIMVEGVGIEPDCMLAPGFQLKLWGTACGLSWSELQSVRQNNFFVYADIAPTTRAMVAVIGFVASMLFIYTISYGTKRTVTLLTSLMIACFSLYTVSSYINEMDSTMTLPVEYIFLQGPGYLALLLTASVSGSIFFTEVFIGYRKLGYCEDAMSQCVVCEVLVFITNIACIVAAFGDLAKFETCEDYVSPIDMVSCPACNSPLVTAFGALSFVSSTCLFILIKFYYDQSLLIHTATVVTLVSLCVVVGVTVTLPKFDTMGPGMYSIFVGVATTLTFQGVYNHLFSKLCGSG